MTIQNSVSFNPQSLTQGTQSTSLTDDQKEKTKEIVAQYDMENFSQEDRLSVRKELHAQGVKGQEMREVLKELPTPLEVSPPAPTSSMEVKEANDPKAILMQLIEQKESGEIEEKDFSSSMAELKMEAIGSVLNLQA